MEGNYTGKTSLEGEFTGKASLEGNSTGKASLEGNSTGKVVSGRKLQGYVFLTGKACAKTFGRKTCSSGPE